MANVRRLYTEYSVRKICMQQKIPLIFPIESPQLAGGHLVFLDGTQNTPVILGPSISILKQTFFIAN